MIATQLSSSQNGIVKAVVTTAATTLVFTVIIFYFFYRFVLARQCRKDKLTSSFRRDEAVIGCQEFGQQGGTLKGLIVDEDGMDVLYLRKLEGGQLTSHFSKVWSNPIVEEEKRMNIRGDKPKISVPIQEIPLLHEPSNTVDIADLMKLVQPNIDQMATTSESISLELLPPEHLQSPSFIPSPVISMNNTSKPPQLPSSRLLLPPRQMMSPPTPLRPPPPPPPLPNTRVPGLLPPPTQVKRNPVPPPIPSIKGDQASSLKPHSAPRGDGNNSKGKHPSGESLKGADEAHLKLKPLHWDKVFTNADHCMVWDEINDGSFRFDDDILETHFCYDRAHQKSSERNSISSPSDSNSAPSVPIFILDPRKSQNTAIVLKSLAISRKEILDSLLEGQGLNTDALEKLTKISPTQEEANKILKFLGNPTKLADAESFLYHILKAVPSAFIRFDAMLFRSNYDPEILHIKESLQILELGCMELRNHGIFLKLLEAILKAGNRMNAGTSRGNAKGFNLNALQKLSQVKSTDGKTTLLYFVVEQVARSEGKRYLMNQNYSLGRSNNQHRKNSEQEKSDQAAKEETEREYLMSGLPALRELNTKFSNVKKAATVDYDVFIKMSSTITDHVAEIQQLVINCEYGERRDGFLTEMRRFLEECEWELKVVREEQTRITDLVKKTTEYYQAGPSKDNAAGPLQLFVIVKEFLDMVYQVYIDLRRKLEKKNLTTVESSPPLSPLTRSPTRIQNLHSYFMVEKHVTSSPSSESDNEF